MLATINICGSLSRSVVASRGHADNAGKVSFYAKHSIRICSSTVAPGPLLEAFDN